MGELMKNFKNGRVVVRDRESGDVITETTVLEFDANNNILTIPRGSIPPQEDRALTLLILSHNMAYEYFGNIRRNRVGDDIRIAIFGEKEKEDRGYPRYELQAKATIDSFVVQGQRVPLNRPVPIQIKNISANGLLIQTGEYELEVGEQIWVNIHLEGNAFTSKYETVRTQLEDDRILLYGCRNMIQDERQAEVAAAESRRPVGTGRGKMNVREAAMYYEEHQRVMERDSGYLRMMEMTAQVMQAGNEKQVELLAGGILQMSQTMGLPVLLNCIHRQRSQREERVRHCLNAALLSGFLAVWNGLEEQEAAAVVQKCLEGSMGKDISQEPLRVQNILMAAETYDTRGSHPTGAIAGIPMVYLEQLKYAGKDQPRETLRGQERELAQRILQCLNQRNVMLADGRTAKILRILPNDVAHPLLFVDGVALQEKDPRNLMWIRV